MIIGPKYKIARRLGAHIFEKTSGKKYSLKEGEKTMGRNKGKGGMRPKTDFGVQMLEKQKVRFTYLITERQFKKYVKAVLEKKAANPEEALYQSLESRLDNAVLRGGLAHTRFFARQMVSHGHITVDGVNVTVPSYKVKKGEVISVRKGSAGSAMFAALAERTADAVFPAWLKSDLSRKTITVEGLPIYDASVMNFSLTSVLEFYKR